ncbi:TPA: YHS domain-containing protein [Vibrio campbellii]|uniref:YHS domain-containing (seleno)protein n=1 Tax=Vibrio sp. M260121 TaxID=3020897 RepID=UPI002F42DC4B|nr:YHS domain-containing protein [Vibrio campbellii]HDM8242577.1 YHS domain-containing protein [Vibrio campbellii]
MKLILKLLSVFFIWGSLTLPAFGLDPVYSDFLGKAIRCYDPVAYFTQSKPVKGDSDFTYRWNDAKWYFSSAENRDAFVKNPEKFAPQYGGYCAWAVSKGYTAKIAPNAWNIHDGKLYLNYSKSVQASWKQNIPGNIASGDQNWPKLLAE